MLAKLLMYTLLLTLMVTLAGCSEDSSADVSTVQQSQTADIDLTTMSSTMVYSQVYDMLINPADYAGKSIKLEGTYYSEYYEITDTTYNFVIINDATGCCPQGLEFISNSEEGYPQQGDTISMIGVFDIYSEGNNQYYRITTEELT